MAAIISRMSAVGLLLGACLFAASLTPSLVPRDFLFQGVLGGAAFALGYWTGKLVQILWRFLELPVLPPRGWRAMLVASSVLAAATAMLGLSRAAEWQNSVRIKVGMEDVATAHPLYVAALASVTAIVLMGLVLLVILFMQALARRFYARVPRRISVGLGGLLALVLVAMLADGLVTRFGMSTLDDMFRLRDLLVDPETPRPDDPNSPGSAQSLLRWDELGAAGRDFINDTPEVEEIAQWTGTEAMKPLRVYVGLNAAPTVEARARLALRELIRVGGFEREVLVVATPTGTGWMDEAAFDTLDVLHGGNVSTVAMQYSYLSSYVSMMVEPEISAQSAQALFTQIYDHWRGLPQQDRPRLYLFGLSLGSFGSESSAKLHEMLSDPIQGALWVGPTFLNRIHSDVTRRRNPDSPAWLPEYSDGSLVRFKNQYTQLRDDPRPWGPLRVVYLQYASDPVVFFDPAIFFRRPAWLSPSGPDVSEQLQWVPGVTFLQLLVDMANSLVTPLGHGHEYAQRDYIEAWVAVTAPKGWDAARLARYKESFPMQRH